MIDTASSPHDITSSPVRPRRLDRHRTNTHRFHILGRLLSLVVTMSLCLAFGGCAQIAHLFAVTQPSDQPVDRQQQAIVTRLKALVEPDLQDNLNTALPAVRKSLADQTNKIAKFKRNLLLRTLADPWDGLAAAEQAGLLAATAAESGVEGLPAVIDILEGGMDRTGASFAPLTFPVTLATEDLLTFLTDVLEQAYQDREHALRHLSPQDRDFLFTQARPLMEHFTPQVAPPAQLSEAEAAARYATLLMQQVDYASLISAAQRLARLGNRKFLQQLDIALHNRKPIGQTVPGITGDLLLHLPLQLSSSFGALGFGDPFRLFTFGAGLGFGLTGGFGFGGCDAGAFGFSSGFLRLACGFLLGADLGGLAVKFHLPGEVLGFLLLTLTGDGGALFGQLGFFDSVGFGGLFVGDALAFVGFGAEAG